MIEENVKIDNNGNWEYQVPSNLAPGTYKITLTGTDSTGKQIQVPYTFSIQANAAVTPNLPQAGVYPNTLLTIALILLTTGIIISSLLSKYSTFEQKVLENKKICQN